MATYAIGDVQGCFDALQQLLGEIGFAPSRDKLWFVGDLVNRGPRSLDVLRSVRDLSDAAVVVLGNHDLHLLRVGAGCAKSRRDDTLDAVLAAPDRDVLLEWLRGRPLLHAEGDYLMVHAGLLPSWSAAQARELASEVEARLRGPRFRELLDELRGGKSDAWRDDLRGAKRRRVIVNAMTRLRFCTPDGRMNLRAKGGPADAPRGFMPWFAVPGRRTADVPVVCGHWAMLGLELLPTLLAVDTGCVWGGALTAVRLEDRRVYQCTCSSAALSDGDDVRTAATRPACAAGSRGTAARTRDRR
jgi:bis(5'-nucleosyl)-tetraphosphatase (symmetrical)